MTPDQLAEAIEAADLSHMDNGDTLDLPGGYTLKVWTEPDTDASINDYDSDGTIEWVRCRAAGGDNNRPGTMDGAARIVEVDYPHVCWWQPPDDIKGDQAAMEQQADHVRDLIRHGYTIVGIDLLAPEPEPDDGWTWQRTERPTVTTQCLGGIDTVSLWPPSDYLAWVLQELQGEMAHDLQTMAVAQ